jgi:DNA-binding IclR family transcriptional regulator
MSVLRLFTQAHGAWTVADMAGKLAVPQSTVYRTVHDLLAAGLLEMAADGHYRLGPAFIEFDRLTRLTDPLLQASAGILDEAVLQARLPCVALLSRLYGDEVMCIADRASAEARFRPSYERGRPMPLMQGATSKVILARLPARRLARLPGMAGKAGDETLKTELAAIRRQGFCVGRGEIDLGLAGLAAPVVCEEAGLVASLSLVVESERLDADEERRLVLLLVSAAAMIENSLRTAARQIFREGKHA